MKGRTGWAVAAGLLSVLAFVQQGAAQERKEGNQGNAGQGAAQERGRHEGNQGNLGQGEAARGAATLHGQTDTGVRGDIGRTDPGRETINNQPNTNYYGREGYGYQQDGWYGSDYGRRGWRGRGFSRTYSDYGNGMYDNGYGYGYYRNEYPGYFAGQSGMSGYYTPEMYGQSAGMANNRVLVRLFVPDANARVWFEGAPTQQGGFDRLYISPPIDPGKNYAYTIKAAWMENGKEVTREQKLPVHANQQALASFDQRFQGNDGNLPPATSTARREDTLGRPEMQEPDRNPAANGFTQGEKTTKSADLVLGKILSVNGDRFTITDLDGNNQRSFQIPDGTQIMQNGQNVGHDVLKPGMQVSVSLKSGTHDVASRVEVKSSAPTERK
jgi:uncharacterized protein (TIGR03000 family)